MRFALGVSGDVIQSDNLTELVSAVVPEYPDDVVGQLCARSDYAVAAASSAQARICARFSETDPEVFEALSEAELTALFADRRNPLFLPYLDLSEEWSSIVPLVLVRTDYAPFTSWPAPTGNVMMIDPYTERTLLVSMSGVRELDVTLFVNEDG